MGILQEIHAKPRKPLLNPIERISEILFGLIMVLTVTCSFSVGQVGRKDIRHIPLAALGCNLAWGVIDAVFYLMARFSEQGKGIVALQALRKTADPKEAQEIIGDALPPLLAATLTPLEFGLIRQRLNGLPDEHLRPRLAKHDWLAAFGVFLFVFLSTLPVVIPLLLIHDPKLALRASNGIAILMLFFAGYRLGQCSGRRRWLTGLVMVLIGVSLVGITIALGG